MFGKTKENIKGREATVISDLGFLSLTDTLECGQCFRHELICKDEDGYTEYMTVVGNNILIVGQRREGELIFYGLTDEELEDVAAPFFALQNNLELMRADVVSKTSSEWLKNAAECAKGVAILKQDPWEALLSFIISQNNNIPRIRGIIRKICAEYGVNLTLHSSGDKKCPLNKQSGIPCEEKCRECGCCYTFPSAEQIVRRPEGLLSSRPGFRYKFMCDAANKVHSGEVDLAAIQAKCDYTYTLEQLKRIKGVGDKVASCVALFGFANLDAFPIDVWMKRAIDTYFDGHLDPGELGRYAGVAQQYIFHYIRNLSNTGNA